MYENIALLSSQVDRFLQTARLLGPASGTDLGDIDAGPNRPHIFFVDPTTGVTSGEGRDPRRPLSTLQAAIDNCERLRGDIIVVARGGHVPTAAIDVNKRGITIVADHYGGNRQNMDEHWIIADAGYTDGPVLEITQGCRIIGLTFASRWTTGPSVRATTDSTLGYNAFYTELIECVFPGWGIGYDGFDMKGASLCAVRRCTFDAIANSGAGIALRGSLSSNPVRNVIEECLFTNCQDGIAVRSATPQDNIIGPGNIFKDMAGSAIDSNSGAGDALVVGNYFEVSKDNAYDQNHSDMLNSGWTFAGNSYIET
jgi:hypothetical protein